MWCEETKSWKTNFTPSREFVEENEKNSNKRVCKFNQNRATMTAYVKIPDGGNMAILKSTL